MKSKTSFFNTGIAKNLLRRCWPLWACYFAALILLLPVRVLGVDQNSELYVYQVSKAVLTGGVMTAIYLSFLAAAPAAMCMFGFMYNTRSCGMMTSLPIKRETMFSTAYLCGLLPMFAANVLAAALTALITIGNSAVRFTDLLQWLAMACMGNVTFYGVAVFCSMLTGSLIILPAVYVALNLASVVAESAAMSLVSRVVYGYVPGDMALIWLSPVAALDERLTLIKGEAMPYIEGWGVLAAYCAVGLLLSAAALLLYRRRKMETATDTVSLPILKPIFRWCMSIGTGLAFAAVIYISFFYRYEGPKAAVTVGVLLVLGAAAGWFAAEMLMQKTVRVFRGRWAGCAVICCAFVALTVCLETDVFGLEQRIPDAADIESVSTYYVDYFRQPENIERAVELNRDIVSHKRENEAADLGMEVYFKYTTKDGDTLERSYTVDRGEDAVNNRESDAWKFQELINTKEAVRRRFYGDGAIPMEREYLDYAVLYNYYTGVSYELPEDEAMSFLTECVLPDVEDGTLGREWVIPNDMSDELDTRWAVEFRFERTATSGQPDADVEYYSADIQMDAERTAKWIGQPDADVEYYSATIQMDAERTVKWIEEHTDCEILPLKAYDDADRPATGTKSAMPDY